MEKKPLSAFQAGLLMAIVLILFSLITYFSGLYKQQWVGYVSYLLLCIMVIVAVINFAKSKNGLVTFGNCFGWGFKAAMFTTVFYLVYLAIFVLIFPEFKEQVMQLTREGMEKQGTSEDQIDAALSMMSKGFYVFMFGATIFFFLLIGVIGSLLGAAFANKKPISPLDQSMS